MLFASSPSGRVAALATWVMGNMMMMMHWPQSKPLQTVCMATSLLYRSSCMLVNFYAGSLVAAQLSSGSSLSSAMQISVWQVGPLSERWFLIGMVRNDGALNIASILQRSFKMPAWQDVALMHLAVLTCLLCALHT
jgi:hypothetical protein